MVENDELDGRLWKIDYAIKWHNSSTKKFRTNFEEQQWPQYLCKWRNHRHIDRFWEILFYLSGGPTSWLYSFINDSISKWFTAFWVCFEKSVFFKNPDFMHIKSFQHFFWMKQAKNLCNHSNWSFLATLLEYEQWLNQWEKSNQLNLDES